MKKLESYAEFDGFMDVSKIINENWDDIYLYEDVEIELNLPIFKRYIQLTLEGKMFFGVQISKIESVTLELC